MIDEKAKKGDFDILFASPETLVGDEEWRDAIKEIDVSLIVVDEFHTVTEWYTSICLSPVASYCV